MSKTQTIKLKNFEVEKTVVKKIQKKYYTTILAKNEEDAVKKFNDNSSGCYNTACEVATCEKVLEVEETTTISPVV